MRRLTILLFLFAAAGCGQRDVSVELQFVALIDGNPASCTDSGTAMSDLRFYVSDVYFLSAAENSASQQGSAAQISDRPLWQSQGVALVDLETGLGACVNGTTESNDTIHVTVPPGDHQGVRLTIGVPFDLNHANPLVATSPLNDSAMHWHWRSGYKFLRAGVATDAGETWMHLGSTGCEGTVGNISGCNAPNRVTVLLTDFDPLADKVAINLSALLDSQAMLEAGDSLNCSSSPAEASCGPAFDALGVEFRDSRSPGQQQVFSVLR